MDDGWIVIPNWRRFQHYKDRNPKWIKVYTELMSDDAFLALSFHQRGVLISLWLEYAAGRRQIIDNTATVSRRLGGRVSRATLEALNDAGFTEVSASSPLAKPEHPASPELLRNSNSGDDAAAPVDGASSSPRKQLLAAGQRFAADWQGTDSDAFEEGLDELEHLYGARFAAGARYNLWDQAISQEQMH
jgi:hypothetical protein